MRLVRPALAAAIATLAVQPVAAQDFSMMSNWAQGQMINNNLQRNLANAGAATPPSGPPVYATGPGIRQPRHPAPGSVAIPVGRGAPRPQADGTGTGMASTAYRPDPAVRERVRARYIAAVRQTAGEQAAQAVAASFAQRDTLAFWAQQVVPDGLHANDVADAITEYWVNNWQMANGVLQAPRAQMLAVRAQVQRTLLSNPGFVRLGDAQKQEMAETFIYDQVIQDTNYVQAYKRRDQATMAKLADAAVARFRKEMNLDLRQLALTDQGFAAKG